jgi:hypothetical protein
LDAVFADFFFAGALAVFDGVMEPSVDAVPVVEDWLLVTPWFIVDELFTSVDVWLALVELFTLRSPVPVLTPGLMFAAALMSVLLMPTFASTPMLGFTLSVGFTLDRLPDVVFDVFGEDEPCGIVDEVCPLVTPWFIVEVAPVLLEAWLAFTLLVVELLPVVEPLVPTLTPGLTFTPAFTSEFATPTFAFTPTFGFTLVVAVRVRVPPVVPGTPVAVPVALLAVVPLVRPAVVPLFVPEAIAPPVVPLVVPDAVVPPVARFVVPEATVPAVVPVALAPSGMQSMWTALAEWSLAWPVALSASLPALGLLSSLQSGVRPWSAAARCAEDALLRGVAAFCVDEDMAPECWSAAVPVADVVELVVLLVVFCAKAGAPSSAASAIALANWERIMCLPPAWLGEFSLPCGSARRARLRSLVQAGGAFGSRANHSSCAPTQSPIASYRWKKPASRRASRFPAATSYFVSRDAVFVDFFFATFGFAFTAQSS